MAPQVMGLNSDQGPPESQLPKDLPPSSYQKDLEWSSGSRILGKARVSDLMRNLESQGLRFLVYFTLIALALVRYTLDSPDTPDIPASLSLKHTRTMGAGASYC
jgi:hypothetical protein